VSTQQTTLAGQQWPVVSTIETFLMLDASFFSNLHVTFLIAAVAAFFLAFCTLCFSCFSGLELFPRFTSTFLTL